MAAAEAKRADGLDAVSIVTPNQVHLQPAKAFMEAGIHVICDKPLTTTVEDAVALAEMVRRSGLIFGLTHNYTGYPLVRQAREMIEAGGAGGDRGGGGGGGEGGVGPGGAGATGATRAVGAAPPRGAAARAA